MMMWNGRYGLGITLVYKDWEHDCITTFFHRFANLVHFVASKTAGDASQVALNFFDQTFKLHELPDSTMPHQDSGIT